jgi:hypothetical protein
VKRNLAHFARVRAAFASTFMPAWFDKASIGQNFPELIGQ